MSNDGGLRERVAASAGNGDGDNTQRKVNGNKHWKVGKLTSIKRWTRNPVEGALSSLSLSLFERRVGWERASGGGCHVK